MSYQVLARRYRPRGFEEVVGQESVAATLRGAILQERLAHAFLFTGPRGVGKTSMARIFAKALNCPRSCDRSRDKSEWGQPCDQCSTCEAIHTGQDIDVVELDGASHRGIDDMRSIIESVNRPATRSLHKIYIIDEVHMLTREAFNALLKTLEEPPAHVKFIFATTEAHRIPDTVLSRCQRFDFHPITDEAIVQRLAQILAAEGRTAEQDLLQRIAKYGKGGLRDAQTLLDQLLTFCEAELRVDDLDRMTGRASGDTVARLVDAALASDPSAVLSGVRGSFEVGADPAILLEQIIDDVRARAHALVKDGASAPGQGAAIDRHLGFLQILLEASQKLKHSPFAEVSVEVTLLKLSRLEEPAALEDVIRALSEIERREGTARPGGVPSSATWLPRPVPAQAPPQALAQAPLQAPAAAPVPSAQSSPPRSRQAPAQAPPDFRRLLSVWDQIRIELEAKHPDLAPFFKQCQPTPHADAPDTIVLELENEFCFRQLKSPSRQDGLLALVREVSRDPWKIRVEHSGKSLLISQVTREAPAGAGADAGPPAVAASPGPPPASDARRAPAPAGGEGIAKSPIVKKSVELFNGRLV